MAAVKPKLKRTLTPEKVVLNTENEKAILLWKGPGKETRSSRQRRELNAGKGGRRRSSTTVDNTEQQNSKEWLKNKMAEQRNEITTLDENINELNAEKNALQASLNARNSEVTNLMKKVQNIEIKIDEAEKENTNIANEMKILRSKKSDLADQLKKVREENEELASNFKTLQNEVEESKRDRTKTEDTLQAERTELAKLRESYDEHLKNCIQDALQKQVDTLTKENTKQAEEIKDLQKSLENLQQDFSELSKKKTELETNCQQYENELSNRIKESSSMIDDMDEMKLKENKQRDNLNELMKKYEEQNKTLQKKEKELEDLITKNENLKSEIESDRTNRIQLQLEIEQNDSKCEKLEQKNLNLIKTLSEKDDVITKFSKENESLNEKINEATSLVEEVLKKSDNCKNMLESEKLEQMNALRRSEDECKQMKSKYELIEQQLNTERKLRHQAESEAEQSRQNMTELNVHFENLLKQINEKEKSEDELNDENEKLEGKCRETEAALNKLREEIEQYRTNASEQKESRIKLTQLENQMKELNNRDEKNATFMESLLKEKETCSKLLAVEKDNLTKLKIEFETRKIDHSLERDQHVNDIKMLNEQLQTRNDDVKVKDAYISKMMVENKTKQQTVTNKLEIIEKLKGENKRFKLAFDQNSAEVREVKGRLDEATLLIGEKQTECEDYRDKLSVSTEACKKMSSTLENLRSKVKELELIAVERESEMDELKVNLDDCMDKHKLEVDQLRRNHSRRVQKLQDDVDLSRNKSKEEINELLNNFSELENELSFCQDELTAKDGEVERLTRQLNDMSSRHKIQEQTLLRELKTLNEQNENILQEEIKKCKSESDKILTEVTEKDAAEITKMQNDFQAKLTSIKEEYEEKLRETKEVTADHKQQLLLMETREENVGSDLKLQKKLHEKALTRYETALKASNLDMHSKTRLINKLTRRIETQQTLIDCVLKRLDKERNNKDIVSNDIMSMLKSIHEQLHENKNNSFLDNMQLSRRKSSLLSTSSDTDIFFTPTKENDFTKNFFPCITSSPTEERSKISKSLPLSNHGEDIHQYLHSMNQIHLSQSLPVTTSTPDHGYVSPGHETNPYSFYFSDQIRAISGAFDKLEMISTYDRNGDEQLSLEVWKQKIHFRLKVLEEHISEIETVNNNSSSLSFKNTESSNVTTLNASAHRSVLFHPSTAQIRELVNNVNQKYEKLNKST